MKQLLNALFFLLTLSTSTVSANNLDAVLGWSQRFIASFPSDGSVQKIYVRPGDKVSKGEKLIELNKEPFQLTIRRIEAELSALKPAVIDTKREYEHAKSLYEQTVLSDVQLQKAQLAYDKARADAKTAQATLDLARWQLEKATVVAPWDAIVTERDVEYGQILVAEYRSKPLLVIARSDVMAANATITPSVAVTIHTGQDANVTVGSKTYPGIITQLSLMSESGNSVYRLQVNFSTDAEDNLVAGQAAMIKLP